MRYTLILLILLALLSTHDQREVETYTSRLERQLQIERTKQHAYRVVHQIQQDKLHQEYAKIVNKTANLYKELYAAHLDITNKYQLHVEDASLTFTGIHSTQLKTIIVGTLHKYQLHSEWMEALLLYTVAAESENGRYLYQLNNGPARGIFQMLPSTEKEVRQYMEKRSQFAPLLSRDADAMVTDLEYQIVTAAVYYMMRAKESSIDSRSLWNTYKRWWNTHEGQATYTVVTNRIKQLAQ